MEALLSGTLEIEYLGHDGRREILPDILHVINGCFNN